mmetsp:Transcript_108428/g.258762  ORF Transcript_108428/g.258762 Transcript_108428/m.258762 type:complete len:238 (-) Transcript_108428:4763-5476(-)
MRDLPGAMHAVHHRDDLLRVQERPLPQSQRLVRGQLPLGPLCPGGHQWSWGDLPHVPGELPQLQQRRGVYGVQGLHPSHRVQPVQIRVPFWILRERHQQPGRELQQVPVPLQPLRDRERVHRVRASGLLDTHRRLRVRVPRPVPLRGQRGRGALLQGLPADLLQLSQPGAVHELSELHVPHAGRDVRVHLSGRLLPPGHRRVRQHLSALPRRRAEMHQRHLCHRVQELQVPHAARHL